MFTSPADSSVLRRPVRSASVPPSNQFMFTRPRTLGDDDDRVGTDGEEEGLTQDPDSDLDLRAVTTKMATLSITAATPTLGATSGGAQQHHSSGPGVLTSDAITDSNSSILFGESEEEQQAARTKGMRDQEYDAFIKKCKEHAKNVDNHCIDKLPHPDEKYQYFFLQLGPDEKETVWYERKYPQKTVRKIVVPEKTVRKIVVPDRDLAKTAADEYNGLADGTITTTDPYALTNKKNFKKHLVNKYYLNASTFLDEWWMTGEGNRGQRLATAQTSTVAASSNVVNNTFTGTISESIFHIYHTSSE